MESNNPSAKDDITGLLQSWRDGDRDAFDRLVPLVYDQLHRMAIGYLGREGAAVTLQPTALVNELWLRLLGWDQARWQNRSHFFGVSAQMMRRVLVDIARRRRTDRRGAGVANLPLENIDVAAESPHPDLLDIDAALDRLAAVDPRKARVVELRFFGGLTVEESAEALQVSVRTIHKDWEFARAWLYRALHASSGP